MLVPLFDVSRDIRENVAVLVHEVDALVHIDYDVEKGVDTLAGLEDRWDDGRTEESGEDIAVECVAAGLHLVVHIEGADHLEVHVDELRREVEIAFEVAGVDDVDDDIGRLLDKLFADVHLLGAVGREGVSAREVDNVEVVAVESGVSLFGIDGDAGVIAYVLVGAGGEIEKGSLAAIGICG